MNTEDIMAKLKELRSVIATRYKAREIRLFGSLAGGQTKISEIDILAKFNEETYLFNLIGLTLCLEDILQRRVDVVPKVSFERSCEKRSSTRLSLYEGLHPLLYHGSDRQYREIHCGNGLGCISGG